ncbi:MAG: tetratricopeptide repeat protein [Pseudomonadota bacterium]
MRQALAAEDTSVAGDFLAGRFAFNQGDLDQAARGLGRALSTTPDDADLRRQVFMLLVASGDVDDALAMAEAWAADDPSSDSADAHLLLALDAGGDERLDGLATLPDPSLPHLFAPLLLAWLDPDPAAAAAELETTVGDRLGDLATVHQAALLDRADAIDEALAVLAAITADPARTSDRALVQQARLLARLGEADAAAALLRLGDGAGQRSDLVTRAAAEIERGETPSSLLPTPEVAMADVLVGVAELLRAQRRPLQATVYARFGLHLAADYDPARLVLAGLLADQEGPAAALAELERIPADSPWRAMADLDRADALHESGRTDEAVATLEAQITARPADPGPAIALGDLLRREQRFDEAAIAYDTALTRAEDVGEDDWRLYYASGIALERSRRWPEAEVALQRALALEPEQPYVLNYLGYSWVDQGLHLDDAKAMLYRAVELRPDDGFIVDSLGWAYYRLGEFPQAVEYLERAVQLEPSDPVINDHLGDAYWRVGREREARFQWERALQFEPDDALIPPIETKLEDGLADEDAG